MKNILSTMLSYNSVIIKYVFLGKQPMTAWHQAGDYMPVFDWKRGMSRKVCRKSIVKFKLSNI